MFPLEMIPQFLQTVAKILPLYYMIDLLRQTWNWQPTAGHSGSSTG